MFTGAAAAWGALREVLLLGMDAQARVALDSVRLHCRVCLAEGGFAGKARACTAMWTWLKALGMCVLAAASAWERLWL